MPDATTNSQQSGNGSQQPGRDGSPQTNRDSQSADVRGRYVPLPGQGPDYVSKGDAPRRPKE